MTEKTKERWNTALNLMGVGLVLVGFVISTIYVLRIEAETGGVNVVGSNKRVVRMMHWQLEPAYRPALQQVIDRYNALPEVAAAGVEVRQEGVTERVYAQTLNVHLISGTAPDISEKGMSALVQGQMVSQFFEPLDQWANEPNPYNAAERLPEGIDPELARQLRELPWRDTFLDGMLGGWDEALQAYYAVPTSFFGSVMLYVNRQLVLEAKQLIREADAQAPRPDWYADLLVGGAAGYVPRDAAFLAWLSSDQMPDTLGRLFVVCEAVATLARQRGDAQLVPIAGSSYSDRLIFNRYLVPFTSGPGRASDLDGSTNVDAAEALMALAAGRWGFDDPDIRGFYEMLALTGEQFPPGFIGLDREQARRRFVRGSAAMIASGAWDAESIFAGAEGRVLAPGEVPLGNEVLTEVRGERRVGYQFDVEIIEFPVPGPGERWSDVVYGPPNSAGTNAGAPYAIYQQSRHKAWAIDFLQYLTSYPVNGWFNRNAGWIPCIIGTQAQPRMRVFEPRIDGLHPGLSLNIIAAGGNFATLYDGQFRNFIAGDIDYQAFVRNVSDLARNPEVGLERVVSDKRRNQVNAVKSGEQVIGVQVVSDLLLGDEQARARLVRSTVRSVNLLNAHSVEQAWDAALPDRAFPTR